MRKEIIISGYGNVAKEFVKLVKEKKETLREKYNLNLVITGIIGSQGMLYQKEGINVDVLLKYEYGSTALMEYAKKHYIALQSPLFSGHVLVDCTPTNMDSGEPGLSYMLAALDASMDIVSVSKGALVHSFVDIKKLADLKGCQLKYSGATAAALPTLDIGEYSLAGTTVTSIVGILNGTSNYILSSMFENGLSFEKALEQAQEKGIAESNPVLDIKGIDSGCKLLLLANRLLDDSFNLQDVSIEGIDHLTKEDILHVKKRGNQLKLLAEAHKQDESWLLEVKVCEITKEHSLYHVKDTNKGIVFEAMEMGSICVTGGASHPRGAAAAALKDLINIYNH